MILRKRVGFVLPLLVIRSVHEMRNMLYRTSESAHDFVTVIRQVGATVLFDCAKAGLLDILGDMLKSSISLETRDVSGNTALHGCASAGQAGAARMLLHAGASVNTRNDNGREIRECRIRPPYPASPSLGSRNVPWLGESMPPSS